MNWPSGDPNQPPGYQPQGYPPPGAPYPPPPGPSGPPPPPPMPYQQPYGQQYGQPFPTPPKTTSGWAIAALIFGIIGGIFVSLVCGIIALNKTKDGRQGGRGMAIAGLVLTGLWVIGFAVFVVLALVISKDHVIATDLKVGDCITDVPTSTRIMTMPTTDCKEPHGGEVYAVLTMPDGSYPGESAIDEWQNKCPDELQTFSPEAVVDDSVGVFVLYPTQETWDQGDRAVTCIATLEPKRAGSIKGS